MVVEKDSLELPVGKKAFNQSFVLSGTGNVIPAVGCTVGYDGIKFDKMNVKAYDIRQGLHLEGASLQKFRKKIGKPDLNTVSGVCTDDQRLRFDFSAFHKGEIAVKSAIPLQFLLQNEKAALRIVPAVFWRDHLHKHAGSEEPGHRRPRISSSS